MILLILIFNIIALVSLLVALWLTWDILRSLKEWEEENRTE